MHDAISLMLGVLALGAFSLLIWSATKGVRRDLDSLRSSIEGLLRRGMDGGLLFVDVPNSKAFIQIKKYIESPGVIGLQVPFPDAPWSHDYVDQVKDYFSEHEVSAYETQRTQDSPIEFTIADFGTDVDAVHHFVVHVLINVFKADSRRGFFVRLENAEIHDVLVDR